MNTETDIHRLTVQLHESAQENQQQAIAELADRIVDAAIDDDLDTALSVSDAAWRCMEALKEASMCC